MAKFFTADLHLFHKNIIKYCERPFKDVAEMNDTIRDRWNAKVSKDDEVYIVGDVGFAHPDLLISFLESLNGTKYLIRGNHDKRMQSKLKDCFAWVKDYYALKIDDPDAIHDKQVLILCHYALRVWDRKHYGTWHLYGHSHGTLPHDGSMSLDVGVDCHDFTPLSYDDIKLALWKILQKNPNAMECEDHHK